MKAIISLVTLVYMAHGLALPTEPASEDGSIGFFLPDHPLGRDNTTEGTLAIRAEPIKKEVSISSLLGDHPMVLENTTKYNGVYSLPGPDRLQPEWGVIPFGCMNKDPCKCEYRKFKSVRWVTTSTSRLRGKTHRISEPLCPPGTISKSFTYSYSYSLNVNAGPDIKGAVIPKLDKFGIRAGFAYTWGRAESSQYTVQCNTPGNNHPCVETFTPTIGVIHGFGYETTEVPGKVCWEGPRSHMEVHVPITDSPSCGGKKDTCGASGVYDSCYYLGDKARSICPNRNLGPTPKDHICPASFV